MLPGREFSQIVRRMAVQERHPRHIPENEHVPPLLIEDIPSGRDALFSLVARVHIQQMCKHHEARSSGDVAVILVLLQCGREGHVKEQDPWDADLSPHLQIQRANPRVQPRSHKQIIEEHSRHAVGVASDNCSKIGYHSDKIPPEDGPSHDGAEVIDDFNQVEIVVPVQEERHNYCGVPGRNPVAKVFEPGKIPGRNGKPFDDRPREDNCDDNLEDHEVGVDLEGL
mmetsp:Transcript_40931/g.68690  ORF Transcript_40931/g.68690 Transcript_40931/m.68690 type:complete len:226 (-) Transcript_40931:308-985(-)